VSGLPSVTSPWVIPRLYIPHHKSHQRLLIHRGSCPAYRVWFCRSTSGKQQGRARASILHHVPHVVQRRQKGKRQGGRYHRHRMRSKSAADSPRVQASAVRMDLLRGAQSGWLSGWMRMVTGGRLALAFLPLNHVRKCVKCWHAPTLCFPLVEPTEPDGGMPGRTSPVKLVSVVRFVMRNVTGVG